jgi:hypothetical protein
MTMRFYYRRYATKRPIISLGGRLFRPRPIIRVTLFIDSGVYVDDCLLDSGADDTVFPDRAANRLGIDLTTAPAGEAATAGGSPGTVHYGRVKIRVTDGKEFREWDAWVAFTPLPLHQPLLGFAGFLQFFFAQFDNENEFVDLTVNNLYGGI